MHTIAIIGSNGVIGRNLIPKLLKLNYQLHLINPSSSKFNESKIKNFFGNI